MKAPLYLNILILMLFNAIRFPIFYGPETLGLKDVTDDENFPVEIVRMKSDPIQLFVCVAFVSATGDKINVAGPLVLQSICASSPLLD